MKKLILPTKSRKKKTIIALGPESEGNFCVYKNGKITLYYNFGDLLDEKSFAKYTRELKKQIKTHKPKVFISDLHPLYKTTKLAEEFNGNHVKVQHHLAHIYTAIFEYFNIGTHSSIGPLPPTHADKDKPTIGIACDGTGYGFDGKIWGGEVFQISPSSWKKEGGGGWRIANLENQLLIGADLAIREPARMLISILSKLLPKAKIYTHVKKYYSKQEFEVLYSQLKQKFNCVESSSTGRILDAISILLGFAKNQRTYKHEAANLLEENSAPSANSKLHPIVKKQDKIHVAQTTPLFEYLIKNIRKDKKQLAYEAQLYVARSIANLVPNPCGVSPQVFAGGGITKNKIIGDYLKKNLNAHIAEKLSPGDAHLSVGQMWFYLSQS